jgi:nondiscriminating glutamyl-tRNA synthetase
MTIMSGIRTRFAPSPTGYLHIGGVRTALFNWLLTRRLGGQFILRIDDTDAERNRPEALQPILDGFRWLGINWDEGPEIGGPYGPYFQSQRLKLYEEAAHRLVAEGRAYPCYRTADELKAERETAEKAKKPYTHRGQHRDTPPAECLRLLKEKPAALRLKVPLGQTIAIEDLIRGHVEWQSDTLPDAVILRPDGRALYNFATVVDDVAMKITHVIRAAEHLPNTAVQVVAYQALGYAVPGFAHVPVVNEPAPKKGAKYPSGVKPPNPNKKLSKREMKKFLTPEVRAKLHSVGWTDAEIDVRDDLNPATVAFYRELGYLPAGLVNYLGRLGWSLDDKAEIIPLDQMKANFDLKRVNNSPASFDPDKLDWVCGEYMLKLPLADKVAGVIPFLRRAGLFGDTLDTPTQQRLERVVAACGDRLKVFSDILIYAPQFLKPEPAYDPKAVEKKLHKEGVPELLAAFKPRLAAVTPFEPAGLEEALRQFAQERGVEVALLNHGLRVGTTGVEVGLGVFDSLAIFGRDEVLRRIDLALALPRGAGGQ